MLPTPQKAHVFAMFKLLVLLLVATDIPKCISGKIVLRAADDSKPFFKKKEIPFLKEHKKTENFVKKLEYQSKYMLFIRIFTLFEFFSYNQLYFNISHVININ